MSSSNESSLFGSWLDPWKAAVHYYSGMMQYVADFTELAFAAATPFERMQRKAAEENPPEQVAKDTEGVLALNAEIAREGFFGALDSMIDYHGAKIRELNEAIWNTYLGLEGEKIDEYWARMARNMEAVAVKYPAAIRDIKKDFGFHFDGPGYELAAETSRFYLYRVLPTKPGVITHKNAKPIILIPPYVLGEHILAFLPNENKSLAHCYANNGIPTYVRVVKDIHATPAVQIMTPEDDIMDTRFFCQEVAAIHERKVTLGGLCQGGTMGLLAVLTGKVDGIVDRLSTAVSPMDGSKSASLIEYMEKLPPSCRDIGYSLVELPNGAFVVSGKILAAVFKWRRFRVENPVSTFYRDALLLEKMNGKIGSTPAAINHWLRHERKDLPELVTKMTLDLYRFPVAEDGTLPVKLFGKKVSFKKLNELGAEGFRFYLGYAPADDLVEVPSATAPSAYVDPIILEMVPFTKGHAGIATSHPSPKSDCTLEGCFPENGNGKMHRGPVCAQMQWNEEGFREDGIPLLHAEGNGLAH